jgi:hypothetical protein
MTRLCTWMMVVFLFSACSSVAEDTLPHLTTEPTPAILEKTPIPVVDAPPVLPAGINALTGLPFANGQAPTYPPMIVKISNGPALVRPQAGIGAADLVFEHYTEGGITRFSAVYYGQLPERVGSIRSARLIDLELPVMYQADLVFAGASNEVLAQLQASDFRDRLRDPRGYEIPYAWRDELIDAPHNLFANLQAFTQLSRAAPASDLRGLSFTLARPDGSVYPVNQIDIRYISTRVQWQYEPTSNTYSRSSDGSAHLDANTQQPVRAANVVVIYAQHVQTDIVESQWQGVNSYSIAINLLGQGQALLFRDGVLYDAVWVRPQREAMLGLRTTTGDVLPLLPGNTWFQIVPDPLTDGVEWVRVS